jgi:hypothetical protein
LHLPQPYTNDASDNKVQSRACPITFLADGKLVSLPWEIL